MNAVIGFPLEHSLSPVLHAEIYRILGIDSELIKDEDDDVCDLVERIKQKPYELIAVTMPHKQAIIELLDEVDDEAREIGSVNTVVNRNGVLYGYNTDISGIEYALGSTEIKNQNVLVVGAGGVARAVMHVVKKLGGNILCANRTIEKAEKLVGEFGGEVVLIESLESEDINVIINTTSIGMYPDLNESVVPQEFITEKHTVFDIVYNPIETRLVQQAKAVGAKTISGIDMFISQGVRQVELWRGIKTDLEKHFNQLKEILIKKII